MRIAIQFLVHHIRGTGINEKNDASSNDDPRCHTPPPPAARRRSSAAHLPPLRCAHGSETAPPCAESATHGHARRSGCVLLRGSGQPAPPTCCSRLRSAGYAVCPSRRSHTPAALSVPRGASHTQPPLWARPAGRSACAGRVGSSRRRALRYGRWAAALSSSFAGGGGVWAPPAADPGGRAGGARGSADDAGHPHGRHAPARSRAAPPATTDRARAPAGAPTPTTSRPRPTHPRRSAPWPRPRRTTWRGTPSHARAPPPPRPCPAASRQSCP